MSGKSDEPGNGESESGEGCHGMVREKERPKRIIATGLRLAGLFGIVIAMKQGLDTVQCTVFRKQYRSISCCSFFHYEAYPSKFLLFPFLALSRAHHF